MNSPQLLKRLVYPLEVEWCALLVKRLGAVIEKRRAINVGLTVKDLVNLPIKHLALKCFSERALSKSWKTVTGGGVNRRQGHRLF